MYQKGNTIKTVKYNMQQYEIKEVKTDLDNQ